MGSSTIMVAKYLSNDLQRFIYSISDDEVYLSRKQDNTDGGVFEEGGTAGSVVSDWSRKDKNLLPRWSGWLKELRNACFQLLGLLAAQRVLFAPNMSSSSFLIHCVRTRLFSFYIYQLANNSPNFFLVENHSETSGLVPVRLLVALFVVPVAAAVGAPLPILVGDAAFSVGLLLLVAVYFPADVAPPFAMEEATAHRQYAAVRRQ